MLKNKGVTEKRAHTLFNSNQVRIVPNIDIDKKYFLLEFLKMLGYSDMYFRKRNYSAFYSAGLTSGFLAIQVGNYSLADKCYSMFAQMLLAAKVYPLALELYRKLRNCAHTHRDIIAKTFALKQMAHCFAKMEKYENAIICYKNVLALGWTIKSADAELLAYEGLALM